MEIITVLISLFLFFFTVLILVKLINAHSSQISSKLPPGPRKLPMIGNLHQLARKNSLPHHRLAELAREYGPIMHLRLGEVPAVVVSSAEVAKEVMKTHDAAFCSRPRILLAEHVFYGCTDIGLTPYGEYWRQVRKIATLELFTAKRIQSCRAIREEETSHLVKLIAMEEGSVINLSKMLFGFSFDLTSRLAFNKKGTEQEEFRSLVADVAEMSSGLSFCDLYPSVKFLSSITGTKRKLLELVRRCNKIADPIINEHISKKIQGKSVDDEDLVDVLLTFHKNMDATSYHDSKFSLTIDNIKAIVLELFGAGSETSSTAMEWAMSELLKNPEVMRKAQDEVRGVLKLDGKDTIDDTTLHKLRYLKQVIKETLRMHPPLPLLAPRESMERCQVQGYDIPAETRVVINAWAIGRDPKYWIEPERFSPERFEECSIDYNGTHFELIPFGAGRRICPGMGLGLATVELGLAMLLYHFDWKLPNGVQSQELNMDETFGIVARRKNNLHAIPSLHSQSL